MVTGGAVRIGRAICLELAHRGCNVVVHYRRSGREATALVAELRALGVRAWRVAGDLSREAACERVVAAARRMAGALDCLVNNAGVFHKQSLADADGAALRRELEVNALAPIHLTRAFAAPWVRNRRSAVTRGRVVNIVDRRVGSHETGCVAYLLSKKMAASFTLLAARELAPWVTVNAVAPGPVLPPPGLGADRVRDRAGATPLRRRPSPEDVARAVAFLLEAEAITGQIVFVDGGQHLTNG